MAVNPVGGGYLNSASLQASRAPISSSLWDQGTRTKLFSFRLILFTGNDPSLGREFDRACASVVVAENRRLENGKLRRKRRKTARVE